MGKLLCTRFIGALFVFSGVFLLLQKSQPHQMTNSYRLKNYRIVTKVYSSLKGLLLTTKSLHSRKYLEEVWQPDVYGRVDQASNISVESFPESFVLPSVQTFYCHDIEIAHSFSQQKAQLLVNGS
jgi:hypothetical protein